MRYKHFSKTERLELSILREKGYSIRAISKAMKRNPASVSRELKKNSTKGFYDPLKANHKAYVKRKYSKYQGMKIRECWWLEKYIVKKLKCGWTPEQISGRLKFKFGRNVVSFKAIYNYLYSPYGTLYCRYLPSEHYSRKKRGSLKVKKQLIPNRVCIDERPQEINKRVRVGDFEGDTLGVPRGNSQTLAGLVDRKSKYFMAKKIIRLKHAMQGFKQMIQSVEVHSLTLDNGVENVKYEELRIPTYFCHPYSSWEKGTIENTFLRLRRFIPKKQSLANFSQEEIDAIVNQMNNTPRKCLNFQTPNELFNKSECCT